MSSVIGLPTSNVPLWRLNYAIVAIPSIFQIFMMGTCVESPRYLISIGRIEDALISLQKLRGSADVSEEFFDIVAGQVGKKKAVRLLKENSHEKTVKNVNNSLDEGFDNTDNNSLDQNAGSNKEEYNAAGVSGNGDIENDDSDEQRPPMSIIEIFRDPIIRKITLIVLFHHTIQQLSGMNAVMYLYYYL